MNHDNEARLIPIISEQTRTTLLEELGLDKPWATVLAEKRDVPGVAVPKLTEEVIDTVASYTPRFVQRVYDGLAEVYTYPTGEIDHYRIDSATQGMAIILRAYHLDTGNQLYYNLSTLRDEDVDSVSGTIKTNMVSIRSGKGDTVLQRVLSRPGIPEQHAGLNTLLNRAAEYASPPYQPLAREGGTAMFKVLSGLWPKITPANPAS